MEPHTHTHGTTHTRMEIHKLETNHNTSYTNSTLLKSYNIEHKMNSTITFNSKELKHHSFYHTYTNSIFNTIDYYSVPFVKVVLLVDALNDSLAGEHLSS